MTLLIGVNNQYRGRDADEYRARVRGAAAARHRLRRRRPEEGDRRVDPRLGRDAVRRRPRPREDRRRDRSATTPSIAKKPSARRALRRHHADLARTIRRSCRDGLHPSGKQYAEWVKLILPEAAQRCVDAARARAARHRQTDSASPSWRGCVSQRRPAAELSRDVESLTRRCTRTPRTEGTARRTTRCCHARAWRTETAR